MTLTRVRLRYKGGTPWKRHVVCRCCTREMLSWDWARAQAWADEHARMHVTDLASVLPARR